MENNRVYNWKDAIWWGIAIGMLIGQRFTGLIDKEWHTYSEAITKGFRDMPEVANPPYMGILLYPLTFLPGEWGADLFILINILAAALACKLIGGNRWGLLFSFPFGWLVWYGQIDGLVALGIGLGYWAIRQQRPYWTGIACLLLGIKPQVGGILALYYLWYIKDLRALIYPLVILSISMMLFGLWPVSYLQRLVSSSGVTFFTDQASNIGLFPWGVVIWLVFLLGPYPLRQRIMMILAATMLSSPYTAYYSVLSLLVFPLAWWSYILFSAPFVLRMGLDVASVLLGVILLLMVPTLLQLRRILNRKPTTQA